MQNIRRYWNSSGIYYKLNGVLYLPLSEYVKPQQSEQDKIIRQRIEKKKAEEAQYTAKILKRHQDMAKLRSQQARKRRERDNKMIQQRNFYQQFLQKPHKEQARKRRERDNKMIQQRNQFQQFLEKQDKDYFFEDNSPDKQDIRSIQEPQFDELMLFQDYKKQYIKQESDSEENHQGFQFLASREQDQKVASFYTGVKEPTPEWILKYIDSNYQNRRRPYVRKIKQDSVTNIQIKRFFSALEERQPFQFQLSTMDRDTNNRLPRYTSHHKGLKIHEPQNNCIWLQSGRFLSFIRILQSMGCLMRTPYEDGMKFYKYEPIYAYTSMLSWQDMTFCDISEFDINRKTLCEKNLTQITLSILSFLKKFNLSLPIQSWRTFIIKFLLRHWRNNAQSYLMTQKIYWVLEDFFILGILIADKKKLKINPNLQNGMNIKNLK